MSNLSEFYSSVYRICEKVNEKKNFSTSNAQIDYILTKYIDLAKEFNESFVPAFQMEVKDNLKSLDDARRFKRFVDIYKNMAEPQFSDKIYEHLNKTILSTPMEERYFLFQCFAQRSNMHYHRGDYEASLIDIDHALNIRLSYSLIERKVIIMNKLNRMSEAYHMVKEIIQQNEKFTDDNKLKLFKKLKKNLKPFKLQKFEPETKISDDASTLKFIFDPRISITKNSAQRYSFRANEKISANTEIMSEVPIILTFCKTAQLKYCSYCNLKVENKFWPCSKCKDVVFCSKTCEQKAKEFHQKECGFISIIQEKLSNQAVSVYRSFVRMNHLKLDKIKEKVNSFSLEDSFKVAINNSVERSKLDEWYFMIQMEMFDRITKQKPIRRTNELCNALFLFMIYCFKMNINFDDLPREDIVQMIEFLALSLVKTQANEYSWHEKNDQGEKIQQGCFQCLFSSNLNHHCEPSANWMFDGKRFQVKTIKDIHAGDEIAISYVDLSEYSLLKRQLHLQGYFMMCTCKLCMKELQECCFAIRCDNCHGPIPYSKEIPNEMCAQCEQNYSNPNILPVIENEFQNAKHSICFISQVERQDWLQMVENSMDTLASYVYLQSKKFIEMVCKLCDRYFQLKMWTQAIEWYEWFVQSADVHLSFNKNDLIQCQNLEKWSNAYLSYLDQINDGKEINVNYLKTAYDLLQKRLTLLASVENKSDLHVLDGLQFKKIIKNSITDTQRQYFRFRKICYEIYKQNNPDEQMSNIIGALSSNETEGPDGNSINDDKSSTETISQPFGEDSSFEISLTV